MLVTAAEELFSSSLNYTKIDKNALKDAKEKFDAFKKAGVIKPQSFFEDEVWQTTDEYANVGLHFNFNRFAYRKYQNVIGVQFESFVDYVKVFCLSLFGKNVLISVENTILDIKKIIETEMDDIYGLNSEIKLYSPNRCIDFFTYISTDEENEKLDELVQSLEAFGENSPDSNGDFKRTLAEFDTYFKFNDIIKDYWESPLTEDKRLFYFPLYLWWVLTAIIPLRPREFILTERKCLTKDADGKYHLRLRRNQQKGTRRGISYKIRDAYEVSTYLVPNYMGKLIENYINATEKYESTELDTLFVTDVHYKKWGQKKHSDSRFLSYVNMNTILRYFYREVICGKYGYRIIHADREGHLDEGEISYIHLGDTRHIALINILQEGGSPVAAMMLAGHSDINMTAHYYSNAIPLIECKTLQQHRKLISTEKNLELATQNLIPPSGKGVLLSNGGMCYSQCYINGDEKDCLDAIGPNGEIGYCGECKFYRHKQMAYFSIDDKYKRKIEEDSEFLAHTVSLVRQEKGYSEDIIEAVLKYSADCYTYQEYLEEKYRQEG